MPVKPSEEFKLQVLWRLSSCCTSGRWARNLMWSARGPSWQSKQLFRSGCPKFKGFLLACSKNPWINYYSLFEHILFSTLNPNSFAFENLPGQQLQCTIHHRCKEMCTVYTSSIDITSKACTKSNSYQAKVAWSWIRNAQLEWSQDKLLNDKTRIFKHINQLAVSDWILPPNQ